MLYIVKTQYAKMFEKNLPIFGISKMKTLIDFVSTEQDVKRGNNRLPLKLARIHSENVLPEDESHAKMKLAQS